MASRHQLAKIDFVKVWVTRLPPLSHPPLSMWRHRVTCLPPKNASAPWGGLVSRWLTINVRQVSYVKYLLACQKSQRSTPYNIVKSVLAWSRVFRRRHLGRRVTAVTYLRWPTVILVYVPQYLYTPDPIHQSLTAGVNSSLRACCHVGCWVEFHPASLSEGWQQCDPLQWRHNGRDSVLNHQPHDCLLNRLFRRRSKKTSKLRVTGLCAGNSPATGEFPSQMASNAENVSIWWRHHAQYCTLMSHECQEVNHNKAIIFCSGNTITISQSCNIWGYKSL